MDPESKKLLEETYSLAEENNRILRSLKRSMMWSRIMSILYWILIIGVSIGAFYFIQPYLDQVINLYGNAKSNLSTINSLLDKLPK